MDNVYVRLEIAKIPGGTEVLQEFESEICRVEFFEKENGLYFQPAGCWGKHPFNTIPAKSAAEIVQYMSGALDMRHGKTREILFHVV